MSKYDEWSSPLTGRYASKELQKLFSPRTRVRTWRLLWLYLAEAEKELGLRIVDQGRKLGISDEAVEQVRENLTPDDEDFELAAEYERTFRHDVMAHVHTLAKKAPKAEKIIHLGATSCYVTDNGDLMIMRDGIDLLLPKLATAISKLQAFALQYKDLPCLAYTHGQSAQPHTIGKRATLWIQDLLDDLRNLERAKGDFKFRGVKGTTGTQASFLALFDGDHEKVKRVDALVAKKAGFDKTSIITSQTYSRKIDVDVANTFASFGATCSRIAGDIRHLAMLKEMEEPFEKDQIGSSAMAYKRNPMRSERMSSLGRDLMAVPQKALNTYANQWLERSLDDSAIRRMYIPEMYLTADALLIILDNVSSGLVVYHKVIERRLHEELPFMATENIIMAITAKGGSRQEAHEKIRVHSHAAAAEVKLHGRDNDLIERVKSDEFFAPILSDLPSLLDPKTFVGRAPQQVEEFAGKQGPVDKALEPYRSTMRDDVAEMKV